MILSRPLVSHDRKERSYRTHCRRQMKRCRFSGPCFRVLCINVLLIDQCRRQLREQGVICWVGHPASSASTPVPPGYDSRTRNPAHSNRLPPKSNEILPPVSTSAPWRRCQVTPAVFSFGSKRSIWLSETLDQDDTAGQALGFAKVGWGNSGSWNLTKAVRPYR